MRTLLLVVAALACTRVSSAEADDPFRGASSWINTTGPLAAADLHGHVVLLDFWTYCCINCINVFPDLARLEDTYHDQPLVVIGVHSGKFDQEKDPENIRAAAQRHGLRHPIAVDSDFAVWEHFGVRSWPTLVLLDVDGQVSMTLSGEGHHAELERAIATLLNRAKDNGTLAKEPLRFSPPPPAGGALAFPGKVLADAERGRLFVADTGHHQVVELGIDGRERRRIGRGTAGLVDGSPMDAAFAEPQGLCLSNDAATLYVADRQNHALRAIDLASGDVRTLAGDGTQGRSRTYHGPAKDARLNSPWDVLLAADGALLIAMAGPHQLWRLDPADGTIAAWAGTGAERCIDGPLARAAFAQPSGLALAGDRLYVADSETSSLRAIALSDGTVTTVAGSGELFGFGHRDGIGRETLLQHPLGVAIGDLDGRRLVFIADTFNHRIRTFDPATNAVATFAGTGTTAAGEPGALDGIGFFEPGGISVAGSTLWIADTNHHRLVAIDLVGKQARVVELVK